MTNIEEYIPILIFLIMAIIMSVGAIFMSFVFGEKEPYFEKSSTYECGFEPFSDTRVNLTCNSISLQYFL